MRLPSCIRLHDIGIDKQVRRWPTINDADLRVWVPINGSSIQERLLHGQKLKAEICEAQFFYHRPLRVFCLPGPVVIRFGVPTHHPQRKKEDTHNCPPICPNLCQNPSCRLVFYMILSGIAHALRTPRGTIGVWVGYDVGTYCALATMRSIDGEIIRGCCAFTTDW